ncbi:MAG: thiamine-monophosphate kinase [Phycisphaerales bacterium]|nr:thiamine-monophosphate kinase [Phycisphaerales bacterium]
MPGEFEFIDWLRARQTPSARVPVPAGDDLAALRFEAGDGLILVGVDQILDGVHFDARLHAPERIGRKAMNRNLSDCAAMACLPTAATLSLALPRGLPIDWTKRLYEGIEAAGLAFDCPIIGGDTGVWDGPLAVTVSIIGRAGEEMGQTSAAKTAAKTIPPVRRSGAVAGDRVYVTGPLGGSILGRHLDFVPRVREARELVARHRISAMIDLSDGLSRDVAHLARESSVGIVLNAAAVPIHGDVARLNDNRAPLDHALHDGEDYELCFTGEGGIASAIEVGRVVAEPDVWIEFNGQRQPLTKGAFEHRL